MPRPSRESIHLETASLWSKRSTCKQENRQVGCVITSEDMRRVLAIGYNGPPRAMPNDSCRQVKSDCGCLHAEMNAIAAVDSSIPNKILFVTMAPCEMCASLIAQAGISKVYYRDDYKNRVGIVRLTECKVEVLKASQS